MNSKIIIIIRSKNESFWRKWVEPMALASLGAGADGIMLEVHPNPSEAAVDPLQPINYNEFGDLMKKIKKISPTLNKKISTIV